ncbi:nitronate monooxygenase [Arthrobacter sp. H35-D1]|uniref:nitronate monooxygenase n=1 Tax=Arthrobacter sp. H35-D1 TaxID=3046202 RepID=UPI0024B932B1|nr:nitronate monooxygenase [Arthrobacter sp. H35-D1]MDJ0314538.1 nitronate monooxygenase [Arthrobacter sp. H35-D1]
MFSTPLIAAPMAGGTTTADLAVAVQGAGAFAFAAGGYKTAEQLRAHIAPLRAAGPDFGVNLFVPRPATGLKSARQTGALEAYRSLLLATASRYGAELPSTLPAPEDPRAQDFWDEKIALLLAEPVPVVSFTFGLAPVRVVEQLHKAGTRVLASVTNVAEALAAAGTGVDGLVVQHANAGGHTAAFLPASAAGYSSGRAGDGTLPQLIAAVGAAVALPLVAAGGVSGAADAKAVLAAGAQAVAIGTALIRTHESGARALHKDALADPAYTRTALTRAFTGKLARALVNDFVNDFADAAPEAYPEVHFLTAPLRAAAAAAADPRALNLWAGSGWKSAQAVPAADVVESFLREL